MAEEKKEPKVVRNLLNGILGNLGIEELLNMAEKLADTKGDSEAKEKVKRIREGLGKTEGKVNGDLFNQILNFVEKASGTEEAQEFEIGGKKGLISLGIGIGGLGGPSKQSSERFEVKRHEPKVQRTEKKTVAKENARRLELDIFDEGDSVLIVGDMPGVTEENIKYEIKDNVLRIWTEVGRKYAKEVELPTLVTEEVNLNYRNGVLEVKLIKRK